MRANNRKLAFETYVAFTAVSRELTFALNGCGSFVRWKFNSTTAPLINKLRRTSVRC
jgi:hypothetical protein